LNGKYRKKRVFICYFVLIYFSKAVHFHFILNCAIFEQKKTALVIWNVKKYMENRHQQLKRIWDILCIFLKIIQPI
jgi:hypothetical protein